jgi:hypothetical protein
VKLEHLRPESRKTKSRPSVACQSLVGTARRAVRGRLGEATLPKAGLRLPPSIRNPKSAVRS